MDGLTLPLKRDPGRAPVGQDSWRQEIAEAKAGERSRISTKAAAHYLGIHEWTLRQLVRDGRGPEPIRNEAKPGSAARNQRMYFTLQALDDYNRVHEGELITRGKKHDAMQLQREEARLQALIELKAAEDALEKARARARRIGAVAFTALDDLHETHPWALDEQGRILGQLWTLDEDVAVDDVLEASLIEALQEPWVSSDAREPYEAVALHLLARGRQLIEGGRSRQQTGELEGNTGPAMGTGKPDRL